MSFKGKGNRRPEEDKNKNYLLYVSLLCDVPSNPFQWIKINPFEKEVTSSFPPQPTRSSYSFINCNGHHWGSGSAAVGSILYLFGGMNHSKRDYTKSVSYNKSVCYNNSVSYIDTTTMDSFKEFDKKMVSARHNPIVLTIGKKIYIFGSLADDSDYTTWLEVLDTELNLFSALQKPPDVCHSALQSFPINAYAIIKSGEEIILCFCPCDLLLLYNVKKNSWSKVLDDNNLRIIRDRRFSSRSPVINNVLYSYDSASRNVHAFDLNGHKWFEEPVKFLVKTKRYMFSVWKEISLDSFNTCNIYRESLGGIHHLGSDLLCLVFYEHLGCDVGEHYLYCLVFRPVVSNSTGLRPSIQAKIERIACHEVCLDLYLDSVAVCVEEENVDEPVWMKRGIVTAVVITATIILLGCSRLHTIFSKYKH